MIQFLKDIKIVNKDKKDYRAAEGKLRTEISDGISKTYYHH